MPIACPQCQTSNADGARFCRSCGTALAAAAMPAADPAAATGVTCDDCGFLNTPGTRYCAKCGYSLVGTVIVSRRDAAPAAPAAATAPPAAPAAAARVSPSPASDADSDTYDPLSAPTQAMHMGNEPAGRFSQMAAAPEGAAAAPSRTGLWIVLGILALVVLGGAGWWLLKPAAKPVEAVAVPPAPAPAPPPPPPVVAAEPAPAPAAPAPVEAAPPPTPTAAAPDPAREAAQKAARDKAARERAEREARAKAQAEQQQQELARQRAAEEERARAAAAAAAAQARPAAPAPAPVVRSVKEICAGGNIITQAVCETRECAKPEYAAQQVCRDIKAARDRALNPTSP